MQQSLIFIQVGAWLHLFQLPGMWLLGRRVVDVKRELLPSSPLFGALVKVIALAVLTLLVGLGVLIGCYPSDVSETAFGQALCMFLGLFWLARLVVQVYYYAGLSWPRTGAGRAIHVALLGIFGAQSVAYLGAWLLAH